MNISSLLNDRMMEDLFSSTRRRATETKGEILNKLMLIVKWCQTKYADKKQLANEDDDLVAELCETWERALYHGLRMPSGSFFNLQKKECTEDPFWNYAQKHLTAHEKERFDTLQYVWTNHGKVKALLRAALNEHCLHRYVIAWLEDSSYKTMYEPWALLLDPEATNLLPSMAAGLSAMVFALVFDIPKFNVDSIDTTYKEEIIHPEKPALPSKRTVAVTREIASPDDNFPEDITIPDTPSANYIEEELAIEILRTDVQNVSDLTHDLDNILSFDDRVEVPEIAEEDTKPAFSPTVIEDNETESTRSRYSMSEGSTSSISMDSNKLQENISELTKRCASLEAKLADLTTENQSLAKFAKQCENQGLAFTISIPRVVSNGNLLKKYIAYEIHVKFDESTEWITLKRYSQFYDMRKKLMKTNPIVKVLDFPPKKKIGNMDDVFVEERRQRLQAFLRHLVKVLPNISSCRTLTEIWQELPFLQ